MLKPLMFALVFCCSLFAPSIVASENEKFDIEKALAQYKGKVVYLDYWASWCTPCRKSFPWMNAMQARYGAQNFTVLSINLDAERANADKFLLESPANFPVLYDPQGISARALKVKGMPSSYLIDKSGKVVSVHVGFFSDKTEKYEQEIQTLLSAK